MSNFKVEIEEISRKVEEIEARSIEEAIEKVQENHYQKKITLEGECVEETNFREYSRELSLDDIKPNNIIDLPGAKAIVLEGNQKVALIKRLVDTPQPYVVVQDLHINSERNAFEWNLSGKYSATLDTAIKDYNYRIGKKDNPYLGEVEGNIYKRGIITSKIGLQMEQMDLVNLIEKFFESNENDAVEYFKNYLKEVSCIPDVFEMFKYEGEDIKLKIAKEVFGNYVVENFLKGKKETGNFLDTYEARILFNKDEIEEMRETPSNDEEEESI